MQEPTFVGPKFLGAQISWGPNFSGTRKVRGLNEIGDHFSYGQLKFCTACDWLKHQQLSGEPFLDLDLLFDFCLSIEIIKLADAAVMLAIKHLPN